MMTLIDGRGKDLSWAISKLNRRPDAAYDDKKVLVCEIIENVKKLGDQAVMEYTAKYDGAIFQEPHHMQVTADEIKQAYSLVDQRFIEVIRKSRDRIRRFHLKQLQNSWMMYEEDGSILGQRIQPIERVGVYVPGGRAAYPSSVLMNILPAKIAGVEHIIMVTPPGPDGCVNPNTLVAASEAGCDMIFKVGGAQAVAALAFGTSTIPKVDKIVGPGNIYVTLAKKEVFGVVDIDMIAGPSEVLVVADDSANPAYVAADLMSQAEHDPMASSLLFTDSYRLAAEVQEQIMLQVDGLRHKETIQTSLAEYGAIVVLDSIEHAIDAANMIAPEHLELCVRNPFERLGKVKHAGAVFLGHYSPEPIGDYMAGPNHVLPTNGTARFFSPLSVDHFIKKSSILFYTLEALENIAPDIIDLAMAEGLTAHANSIEVRFKQDAGIPSPGSEHFRTI